MHPEDMATTERLYSIFSHDSIGALAEAQASAKLVGRLEKRSWSNLHRNNSNSTEHDMGVPALFRWLSTKYPKIASRVVEERSVDLADGTTLPIDWTGPNPNGQEFDNLYLDMNGIVHPCTHPENKPAPTTEDEAMREIFIYIDRIMAMVRPRKVLYMAIDGVAPRAKMNQQRSRRFRAAQEAQLLLDEEERVRADLHNKGMLDQALVAAKKERFDSNCITPGTPFMSRLAEALHYYVTDKMNNEPGWQSIEVILSDASVPGEGEHKIMNFIRAQRNHPAYDPDTSHVLYGLDADLIMLGLATHEPHFKILREDVFAQEGNVRSCNICGQPGHLAAECTGKAKEKVGEFGEKEGAALVQKPFIFLHVNLLREYLGFELQVPSLPFAFDLERAIDDWVFMCFFVGNDFLPHLPSLEIREGAIDKLIEIYKRRLPDIGGYLTKDGAVSLEHVQIIMEELGHLEDEIFQRRRDAEMRRRNNEKRRKHAAQQRRADQFAQELGTTAAPEDLLTAARTYAVTVKDIEAIQQSSQRYVEQRKTLRMANMSAAQALRASLLSTTDEVETTTTVTVSTTPPNEEAPATKKKTKKRKLEAVVAAVVDPKKAKSLVDVSATEVVTVVEAEGVDVPVDEEDKDDEEEDEEPDVDAATDSSSNDETVEAKEKEMPTRVIMEEDEDAADDVRLWEAGWKERFYQSKFEVDVANTAFRKKVVTAYAEGLCWVMQYYYQGCQSWKWFYPYHYAPFASDFSTSDLAHDVPERFPEDEPSHPYEQLMAVLPAGSKSHIPPTYWPLMTDDRSPIKDFYPERFRIDLNGKKYAWQGVAILPFIEEARLLEAMALYNDKLTQEEQRRNQRGVDVLFVSRMHKLYEFLCDLYGVGSGRKQLNMKLSRGLSGTVEPYAEACLPGSSYTSPLKSVGFEDIPDNTCICVAYFNPDPPEPRFIYPARMLQGVTEPPRMLTEDDYMHVRHGGDRRRSRGGGHGGGGGGRSMQINQMAARRFVEHGVGHQSYQQNNTFNAYQSPNGAMAYHQQQQTGYQQGAYYGQQPSGASSYPPAVTYGHRGAHQYGGAGGHQVYAQQQQQQQGYYAGGYQQQQASQQAYYAQTPYGAGSYGQQQQQAYGGYQQHGQAPSSYAGANVYGGTPAAYYGGHGASYGSALARPAYGANVAPVQQYQRPPQQQPISPPQTTAAPQRKPTASSLAEQRAKAMAEIAKTAVPLGRGAGTMAWNRNVARGGKK